MGPFFLREGGLWGLIRLMGPFFSIKGLKGLMGPYGALWGLMPQSRSRYYTTAATLCVKGLIRLFKGLIRPLKGFIRAL